MNNSHVILSNVNKGYTNLPLQSVGPNTIYACAHIWKQPKKLLLCIFILVVAFLLFALLSDPMFCDGPDININIDVIKEYELLNNTLPRPIYDGSDFINNRTDITNNTLPRPEGASLYPVPGKRCPSCLERGVTV
jgi:hypothetical protein